MDEKTRRAYVVGRLVRSICGVLPDKESDYKMVYKDADGKLEYDDEGKVLYDIVDYSRRVRKMREDIDRDYGLDDPELDAVLAEVRAVLDSVEGKTDKPRVMAKAGKALMGMQRPLYSLLGEYKEILIHSPWYDEEKRCFKPDYLTFCEEVFGDTIAEEIWADVRQKYGM